MEEEVWEEKVTHSLAEMTDRKERDAFDTLEEKEPEKYQKLQNSLIMFVNKNLEKLNLEGKFTVEHIIFRLVFETVIAPICHLLIFLFRRPAFLTVPERIFEGDKSFD